MGEIVHSDCIHFNGYKPCKPHKDEGIHCKDCKRYKKTGVNILIIKLQAAGEVMRNTPLIIPIKKKYPDAKIFWLTKNPELVPEKEVFKVLKWCPESLLILKDIEFEVVYSLDKDLEACALANQISAKTKKGFTQKNGVILPFDKDAERKWLTGIFDDLMKKSKQNYLEDTFEICGFKYAGEKYILPEYNVPKVDINKKKKVIALNTGAGNLWKPRIYSTNLWIKLAKLLIKEGYEVIIVGGPEEKEKNPIIAKESGAKYFGLFSLRDFIGLISQIDLMVTAVTFGFHVAVGLNKKTVLLNNTFNKYEFYYVVDTFKKGVILEPELPCLMCYKKDFDKNCKKQNCMDLITPEKILENVKKLVVK